MTQDTDRYRQSPLNEASTDMYIKLQDLFQFPLNSLCAVCATCGAMHEFSDPKAAIRQIGTPRDTS
jgi:hypothetical protein